METLINKEALVLFFIYAILIILLILAILIILTINSQLELHISNLKLSTAENPKVKAKYKIELGIILFNKIKIFNINTSKMKVDKQNLGKVVKKIQEKDENYTNKKLINKVIKNLRNMNIEIKKLNLKLQIGVEDAAQTALLIGVISSIIAILLRSKLKEPNKYEVMPIYQNKNILKLELDCIIRINLANYIYKNIMKGRKKNERKSSYRKSYAYSNE